MGPKHTGELWVYIGTPLPNLSGNTGVIVCYVCVMMEILGHTKLPFRMGN